MTNLPEKLLEMIPKSVRMLRKISAEALDVSITFQQFRILKKISEGQSLTQMAETLQISLAAVSKTTESIVVKKFVVRKVAKDKRCQILKLTPLGKKILDKVGKHRRKVLSAALEKLSLQQTKELTDGLEALDQLILHMKEV